jgi:hypothetical protein
MRHVVVGIFCGLLSMLFFSVPVLMGAETAVAVPAAPPSSADAPEEPSSLPLNAQGAQAPDPSTRGSGTGTGPGASNVVAAPKVSARPAAPGAPGAPSTHAAPAGDDSSVHSGGETPADATRDRAFLLPTADTLPAGSLVYNDYELIFMGLTYAIRDGLQITATTFIPVAPDAFTLLLGSVKWRIVSTPSFKLAILGGVGYVSSSFSDGGTDRAVLLDGGIFASQCFDVACESMLTAGAMGFDTRSSLSTNGSAIIFGGSLLARVSQHVKIIAELNGVAGKNQDSGWSVGDAGLLWYGLRFFGGQVAGDVGFFQPIGTSASDPGVIGYPFLSLSVRIF